MDAEKVREWAREADSYTAKRLLDSHFLTIRSSKIRDIHFARLVRAAALEEAAKVCHEEHMRDDLTGDYRYGAGICESRIRALAASEKEPR